MTPRFQLFRTLALSAICLLGSGCCGARLCSVRFDQPLHELGGSPNGIPYTEPPCGFQTVGGPPAMGGPPPPPMVSAPAPRFVPVPTRPVFAPYEVLALGPVPVPAERSENGQDASSGPESDPADGGLKELQIREINADRPPEPAFSTARSSGKPTQLNFVSNPLR